jgi:hypothetical protein
MALFLALMKIQYHQVDIYSDQQQAAPVQYVAALQVNHAGYRYPHALAARKWM